MKFKELCTLFLDNHAKPNYEFSTYQKYDGAIRHYVQPYFENSMIDEITRFQVGEFKAEVLKLERSDAIKNFVFSALKTVLQKATEWDLIDRNPASSVKPPRKGLPRTEYWSADEAGTFLLYMKDSPRLPLYLVALNSGMRVGEIFGLKWDCVDTERRVLTVRRTWDQKTKTVKETTKTHKARIVPLNQPLFEILVELRRRDQGGRVLKPESVGLGCASHLARSFKQDAIAAQIRPIKFHDLRHTFATNFMANGGAIHALARILGHTTTNMTERYSHFGLDHVKQAAGFVSFSLPKPAEVVEIGHKLVMNRDFKKV
jgi:integrase